MYLLQTPKRLIDVEISKIIKNALKSITIPDLASATRRSLIAFYNEQYNTLSRINGSNLLLLLAYMKLTDKDNKLVKNMPLERARRIVESIDNVNLYGQPMQKYSEEYIKQNVKPVFDRLIKQFPKDPDDISGHNSLRNRAEMEVRYNGHQEQIEELKKITNLVIASSHADCSDRCRKWQSRVYSLNGTYGTTDDGRKYVPLEVATDVYYTTKVGKVYKNGLLGFNCRHYLTPYKKGYKFPKPSAKEEAKQYKITERQRYLERKVREYRTKALYNRDINKDEYLKFRKKSIDANKEYIKYSRDNNRAYYPSRTKIFFNN
jgi:hypothetical protein